MSIRKTVYAEVSRETRVPYRDVVAVLGAATKMFRRALKQHGRVEVRGIGIFTAGVMRGKPTVFFTPAKGGEARHEG